MPLILRRTMNRQFLITRQHENLIIALRTIQRIVVEVDIPDAGRGVQRFSGIGRVGVKVSLFGGCVGTDEGDEVVGVETFVCEQRDEVFDGVVCVGEETSRCGFRGVFSAYEGLDSGSSGAGDGGVVVCVLRQIRVSNVELRLYTTEYGADVLQTVVFRTGFFAEVHEE